MSNESNQTNENLPDFICTPNGDITVVKEHEKNVNHNKKSGANWEDRCEKDSTAAY